MNIDNYTCISNTRYKYYKIYYIPAIVYRFNKNEF
jgi:hypothetical protein